MPKSVPAGEVAATMMAVKMPPWRVSELDGQVRLRRREGEPGGIRIAQAEDRPVRAGDGGGITSNRRGLLEGQRGNLAHEPAYEAAG